MSQLMNEYVILQVPSGVSWIYFYYTAPTSKHSWDGVTWPIGQIASNVPETYPSTFVTQILVNTQFVPGSRMYVGYGTSSQEMMSAGRYRLMYTF